MNDAPRTTYKDPQDKDTEGRVKVPPRLYQHLNFKQPPVGCSDPRHSMPDKRLGNRVSRTPDGRADGRPV